MGRRSVNKKRKKLSKKMMAWLDRLATSLKYEDLEKINMDSLATLSQISKSTIYNYFETKEEIFSACLSQKIDTLESFKLNLIDSKEALISEYLRLIEWICQTLHEISVHFISEIKHHYPSAWALAEEYIQGLLAALGQLYTEGVKMGAFKDYPIDLLIGMDKYFILEYLSEKSELTATGDLEPLIRDYLKLKLEGLIQ